jgi:5-methylthioadenosine/S-adenosylhomocysteine deaminase
VTSAAEPVEAAGHPTPAPCDLLVVSGQVVTVDGDDRVLEDGGVAVADARIVDVGPTADVRRRWSAVRILDARGGLVLPGLINAHTHLAMTLYRGCADDVDLQGFLAAVWRREGATLSADTVRLGARAGVVESLRAGVTTALDMYFHHDVALEESERLGFRLVGGPALFDFPGPDYPGFGARFSAATRWLDTYRPGLALRPVVAPHATYTLDAAQLRLAGELAAAHDAIVHVHASENAREVKDVLARYGRTPVEVLDHAGLLRPSTVLAHAVVLREDEMERIAASGAAIAHCPASNCKLASGIAPVPELRRRGVPVGIGTDGPASSNDLDLWAAMRLTAYLHKVRLGDATALPAAEVVRMATLDGARALGLADRIGSLEAGKRADLVVLSPDAVAAAPVYDAPGALVYAVGRAEVRSVLVDGRPVVEDGRVTGVEEAEVAAGLRAFAAAFGA